VRAQRNGLAEWLELHPRALGEVHGEALGALDLTLQAGRSAEERIRGMRRDSRDLEAQLRRLQAETLADALTGVASRRALDLRMTHECAVLRRTASPFAVFMLDADNLKKVNDTRGHATGDRYLCEMANRVRMTVRDMDMVARLGGDEFVVVAPATGGEGAADLARRLATQLCAPFSVAGGALEMSVSIGWVIARDGAEPEELLARADAAMYQAKAGQSGGDETYGFVGGPADSHQEETQEPTSTA
jgi:diguanylate cyclase (GGDEF)-like protein